MNPARVGRNERSELRRMGLTFAVDVPTPYAAPEHRKALGIRPEGVAHRTWATVPRDRSRVGQRGSQSRGAEEQRGIGGSVSLDTFLSRQESIPPAVREPLVNSPEGRPYIRGACVWK